MSLNFRIPMRESLNMVFPSQNPSVSNEKNQESLLFHLIHLRTEFKEGGSFISVCQSLLPFTHFSLLIWHIAHAFWCWKSLNMFDGRFPFTDTLSSTGISSLFLPRIFPTFKGPSQFSQVSCILWLVQFIASYSYFELISWRVWRHKGWITCTGLFSSLSF